MRRVVVAISILVLVGLMLPLAGEVKGKTHDVVAEIVAVDVNAKTITIKDDDGNDKTAPVRESAVEELKKVKAGDRVVLTCLDNEKGEHEAIVAIKPAKS
jgi:hypothetical protein